MRRAGGYLVISGSDGKRETDTFTCCHCQRVVVVAAKASAAECGGWCFRCSRPVCPACSGKDCTPFERRLEAAESRARLLEAVGAK